MRGAHNSSRATSGPGLHDYNHATRVPALPAALLTLPLGCTGATGAASTLAVAAREGRTSGTSGQLSSDDHTGEVELSSTG